MKKAQFVLLCTTVTIIGLVAVLFARHAESPISDSNIEQSAKEENLVSTSEPELNQLASTSIASELFASNIKAALRAPSELEQIFLRNADLFVSSGAITAGEDSKEGEVFEDEGISAVSVKDDAVTVKMDSFSEYNQVVEVSVLGLQSGPYELSVFVTDTSGLTREYVYSSTTAKGVLDTYSFSITDADQESVKRFVYPPSPRSRILSDGGACSKSVLEERLTKLLIDSGWDMSRVPLVGVDVGYIDSLDPQPLPFEYEKVCAIEMTFKHEYMQQSDVKRMNFAGLPGYSSVVTIVGEDEFRQLPADGPLGSSNTYPITTTGKDIQFLELYEGTSLIPVNFPAFSACPCAHVYTALLTAPMYQGENRE